MTFKVVILSAQPSQLVPCVRSVVANEPALAPDDIIVVEDGARAGAESQLPPVRWIEGVRPFVFARNANLGMQAAGTDVILLNDDARLLTRGGFTRVVETLRRRPEIGICSAGIRGTVSNPNQLATGAGELRLEGRMLAFVCVYIPRLVYETLGPLDEQFTGYGFEDDDYCARTMSAGLRLAVWDGCEVEHTGTATFGMQPDLAALLEHNRRLFVRKWREGASAVQPAGVTPASAGGDPATPATRMRRRARRSRARVAVYAIARDEEQHVERWAASAADADRIVLVDTGSRDRTVDRAHALGIDVHEIRVEPFRYDAARNRALDLVPPDIDVCVSLDLDEVLVPGWRQHVEDAWRQGATRVRCWFEWPWSDTYPALRFTTTDRVHARHGYRWRYCVHEQPYSLGAEVVVESAAEIHHLRDSLGSRPQYLGLLRLSVAEHPSDGRIAHLLGSEARMNGLRDEARFHEHRALALPLGPHERLHAMLMLSHLEPEAREAWVIAACAEFPYRREPWCELAQLHLEDGQWRACRAAAHAALRIEQPADDYLTNVFAWGPWPEQLAALASLELGDDEWALHHARRALRAAPGRAELAELLQRATDALCHRRATRTRADRIT